MTSRYGSFSPNFGGNFCCCCQNPFAAILRLKRRKNRWPLSSRGGLSGRATKKRPFFAASLRNLMKSHMHNYMPLPQQSEAVQNWRNSSGSRLSLKSCYQQRIFALLLNLATVKI